jgi:hypothetical protein
VGQIQSRRGDVSIENVTGGIAAKTLDAGEVNILADEITLKALGSIGSAEQPLVTEQRDVTPSKISGTVEEIYQGQKAEETVSGAALPGKGIIGIQLAQRYEELTDETEQVTVTLLMADGSELQTGMNLQDLRELTKQANTTDGNVYNFLTDGNSNAALQVVVRYDWVRYLDPEAGTRTDAESETGSIYLKENTGKLNIGQIKAAEDIFLSAPDGVYSVLTEEEIASGKQNIHASGESSQVTVDAGTGGLGTGDNPLRVQVSGDNAVMNSTSEDGIYLRGTGDLNLRFEDPSRHVEIELIAADNPGGILYLPSGARLDESKMAMNGLILDDERVITAMEKDNEGKFIPVRKKGSSSYVSEDMFGFLFSYIENLISDMGKTVKKGDFAPEPIDGLHSDACKYCDFAHVCRKSDEEHRKITRLSNDKIMEYLKGENEDEV